MRVVLARSRDTVRFEVPVVAQRCGDGRGVLLHGAREGQGVLVWLRGAYPPDTGAYPLLSRGDSVALRGVIAAVRFQLGDVPHGVTLEDGSANVTQATPELGLHVSGLGLETTVAEQRTAELVLERVPLAPDTVPCRVRL
ncbi:MAG: hypothetical protein ACREMW_00670 [Gemmatimonadales bacterium]